VKLTEACEALNAKQRIEFKYSGRDRVVEVHAAGYTRDESPIMLVWQVRGGSTGGDSSGWKLLRLDEIGSSKMLDEKSEAPRPGYRKGDPAIAKIVCEI
jgi:hypothetical protein